MREVRFCEEVHFHFKPISVLKTTRKHGQCVWVPCLRTLRHRHSQARRRWNRQHFPRSLRSGLYRHRRSAAPGTLALDLLDVYYNGGKAPEVRCLYNRLRKLPEKRPIAFYEASCGACAPRLRRKPGLARQKSHVVAASPFLGSPQVEQTAFPPQLTQRVLPPPGSAAPSRLTLYRGLQTHFNNHYFTLTRFTPRFLKFLKGNVKNVLVKKKELPLQA